MTFYGLCFITYEGKKVVGRPSNSFKVALEKSQKSFLGQLRVIRNYGSSPSGLEILRNGQLLLKTSNINHIKFNWKTNAFEVTFFGNKTPKIIEFMDKSALIGFQMNSTHFLTITFHMHFISFVKYGFLPSEEQNEYQKMVVKLEKLVHENQEIRNVAIANVTCSKHLLDKINDSKNQQNIKNYAATNFGIKEIPQQQVFAKRLSTISIENHCQNCLKKQAAIDSLKAEYEEKLGIEMQNKQNLEKELSVIKHLHEKELRNVEILTNALNARNNEVNLQKMELEQLHEKYEKILQEKKVLQQILAIQEQNNQEPEYINEETERFENLIQPHELQDVYISEHGECYHAHPRCQYIKNSTGVKQVLLLNVSGSKRPCSRCVNKFP